MLVKDSSCTTVPMLAGAVVGRTGCPLGQSARVPLDPLLAALMKLADEGVSRGPGGPPHHCGTPEVPV
jgi:hypothetical protein